jgi:general secretion pathway protein A
MEAIIRLLYAVKGSKGAAMLTGEVGCGKTLICFKLLEELKKDKYESVVIANPCLSTKDFLKQIYEGIGGVVESKGKGDLLQALVKRAQSKHQEGREIVILVDEAHLVVKRPGLYEELRMLLNYQMQERFLFSLILVGQPELMDSITHIPQLRQRIHLRYHLTPLDLLETHSYILHRLKLANCDSEIITPSAREEVFRQSNGVPRMINTICDLSLLIVFGTQGQLVEREDILQVRELLT